MQEMAGETNLKMRITEETMKRFSEELVDLAVKRWVRENTDGQKHVDLGRVEGYRIVATKI